MNYIGSKNKLSNFLYTHFVDVIDKKLEDCVVCDAFCGSGAVGKMLKKHKVKKIIANDQEYYSYILNQNYIANSFEWSRGNERIEYLNALCGVKGKIFQHYCLGGGGGRMYFSDENGKKIDAVRIEIQKWFDSQEISQQEYYFFLASLLESADSVANTASVYGAFLKHYKKTAQKPFEFKPAMFLPHDGSHKVYNQDANKLITRICGDILYLDPPYNSREYGANYHLLNTIALYDDFEPRGKTGLRDYERSKYCKKSEVALALEDLIANARFRYIFLSYNNEGLLAQNQIKSIFEKYGKYDFRQVKYQRFKADCNRIAKSSCVDEHLHILKKS